MPGRIPFSAAASTPPALSLRPLALAISLALGAGMARGADSAPADATAAGDDVPVMQTITVTGSSDANVYTARKWTTSGSTTPAKCWRRPRA